MNDQYAKALSLHPQFCEENETQTGAFYDTSFFDHSSGHSRSVELRGRGAAAAASLVASV
jgi:hypothetical protein